MPVIATAQIPVPDQKPAIRQLTRWLAVVPPLLSVAWVLVALARPDIAAQARKYGVLDSINDLVKMFGGTPIAWIAFEKIKDAATLHGLAMNAAPPAVPTNDPNLGGP